MDMVIYNQFYFFHTKHCKFYIINLIFCLKSQQKYFLKDLYLSLNSVLFLRINDPIGVKLSGILDNQPLLII